MLRVAGEQERAAARAKLKTHVEIAASIRAELCDRLEAEARVHVVQAYACRNLACRLRAAGDPAAAEVQERHAGEYESAASVLRGMLR